MSLATAIAAVETRLQTVPNIGNSYSYIRGVVDEESFNALFKDSNSGRILAWMLTRESTETVDIGTGMTQDNHQLVIYGYMSLSDGDASETIFQNLIEQIRLTFNATGVDRRFPVGGVSQFWWSGPLSARLVTQGQYGDVLCHHCQLTYEVQERI